MPEKDRISISDSLWRRVEGVLEAIRARSGAGPRKGRPPKPDRPMVEAMFYIPRAGFPWRDLPGEFGPSNSVDTRWRRWNRNGIWASMLKLHAEEQEGSLVHLDATHVKVHQDVSQVGGEPAEAGIGRTKGGLKTKVTALVDGHGRPLQILLDGGNSAAVKAAEAIEIPSGKRVVAGTGSASNKLREEIWNAGACPCIQPLSTRKRTVRWHRAYYKQRHRLENFFQGIKRYRRGGTRYDKLALIFLAFVQLAGVLDWLRN